MKDSEWYGEPHTLIVHEVRLPDGPLDDGDLGDYGLEHPTSCKERRVGEGENSYWEYTCAVAHEEAEGGLAASLRYSGTPVTEPGTYKIQSWGRKYYVWDACAYEYDCGVGLAEPEAAV